MRERGAVDSFRLARLSGVWADEQLKPIHEAKPKTTNRVTATAKLQ